MEKFLKIPRFIQTAGKHTTGLSYGYNHYRLLFHENEFVRGKSHVNGIESFWSFAKRRLAKFNGRM